MNRIEKALQNHKKGYNCAQAVACAFCDKTIFNEDDLFRMSEAFGGGMGCGSICGAVSAMVMLAGLKSSKGINLLPETNKKESYKISKELIDSFEEKNGSVLCKRIKDENLRSCDGCIEDAVKILEEKLF